MLRKGWSPSPERRKRPSSPDRASRESRIWASSHNPEIVAPAMGRPLVSVMRPEMLFDSLTRKVPRSVVSPFLSLRPVLVMSAKSGGCNVRSKVPGSSALMRNFPSPCGSILSWSTSPLPNPMPRRLPPPCGWSCTSTLFTGTSSSVARRKARSAPDSSFSSRSARSVPASTGMGPSSFVAKPSFVARTVYLFPAAIPSNANLPSTSVRCAPLPSRSIAKRLPSEGDAVTIASASGFPSGPKTRPAIRPPGCR